jgi:hypothetical protein
MAKSLPVPHEHEELLSTCRRGAEASSFSRTLFRNAAPLSSGESLLREEEASRDCYALE